MIETRVHEALGIVDFLVQTNDVRHITFTKIGEVGFRCVQRVALAEGTMPRHPVYPHHSRASYIFYFTLRMWA